MLNGSPVVQWNRPEKLHPPSKAFPKPPIAVPKCRPRANRDVKDPVGVDLMRSIEIRDSV